MKILVGISGGVDSASVALMLKEQGFEVEGVIMAIWEKNPNLKADFKKNSCYNPNGENIEEAKKISKAIGIKLNIIDCVEEYKNVVLENFKNEYLSGRTPNPCVWCNCLIKFGAMIDFAKKEGIEFDKFATGHYSRIEEKEGRFLLKRAKDEKKDQSYFLYRLTQKQLSQIIMPLGDFSKEETRQYAKSKGLFVADKQDSQDFYSGDVGDLLEVVDKKGNIVDLKGNILGEHNGIWHYTVGQRKGIKISAPEALYVLELREKTNEVVVGFKKDIKGDFLYATNLNWIKYEIPPLKFSAKAKIRSAQKPTDVDVEVLGEDKIKVIFKEPQGSIAHGQSVVLYDGDYVIGGGIIE